MNAIRKTVVGLAAGAAMVIAATSGQAAEDKTLNIGWTAWSSTEATTNIAKYVLSEKMGYDVEMTLADIAIQYQGVANGDLDMMMMSWLPETHGDYYGKQAGKIVDMGAIYTRARLGWVVPNYIPEDQVKTIADLAKPEVADKLDNKIQGIDPGAGLMRLSGEAIETYGLDDYTLVSASGAAMTAALDRAIKRNEWIVVTGWSPHWMFGKYDLRYLEDPEGALGGPERVHAIGRPNIYRDKPEVFEFFSRFFLPLDDLEAVMAEAQDSSYEEAAKNYVDSHEARVNYWVTGKFSDE